MPRFNISNSTITSQNQGGGSKKKGFPSTIGLGKFSINNIKKRASSCSCVCPINEIILQTGTHFTTQTQLDTLRGVTKIIGDFSIQGFTGQPDFSVFNCLKEVTGFFNINASLILTTISGFPNLEKVGGIFLINANDELITISGFPKLNNVGLSLQFLDNVKLTTISGFSNLVNVNRFFTINNNTLLTTISGFHELVSVGGEFNISVNGTTITPGVHVIVNPIAFAKITIPGELVTLAGIDATHQLHLQNTLITALNWVGIASGAAPAFVLGL